jgi:hypothetical protein
MILVEMWKANRERCGGRFNWYFLWLYPLAVPFSLIWDLLSWAERVLTPQGSDNG